MQHTAISFKQEKPLNVCVIRCHDCLFSKKYGFFWLLRLNCFHLIDLVNGKFNCSAFNTRFTLSRAPINRCIQLNADNELSCNVISRLVMHKSINKTGNRLPIKRYYNILSFKSYFPARNEACHFIYIFPIFVSCEMKVMLAIDSTIPFKTFLSSIHFGIWPRLNLWSSIVCHRQFSTVHSICRF